MKKIFLSLFVVMMLVVLFISPVQAQIETPHIVDTTVPVDSQIIADINAWLATSAPVQMPYWVITFVGETRENGETFVSLLAVDIENPTDDWYLTGPHTKNGHAESDARWMGSVIIRADHTVYIRSDGGYSEEHQTNLFSKMAMLFLQPPSDGGGSNVRFPWETGKAMIYGVRGIHAAGSSSYALGFSAVDFLGGDGIGPGIASNRVFAVANGIIDYVCQGTHATTIRTENTETNDYYIYAHLIDNATLIDDYTYYQGDSIGFTKYGSFTDGCGFADQQPTNYHLHFGFKPANGFFQMQNCILNMSSEEWLCGNVPVTTGQSLRNYGSPNSTGDDASAFSNQMSFWDYLLTGGDILFQVLIIDHLPDHQSNSFLYALYNTINVTVRIARVILYGNISLSWFMVAISFGLTVKAILFTVEVFAFLAKVLKSLLPMA